MNGPALRERDDELRALAGLEHRRLLAGDLEAVVVLAGVLDREGHLADRRRLRRQLERVVAGGHVDRDAARRAYVRRARPETRRSGAAAAAATATRTRPRGTGTAPSHTPKHARCPLQARSPSRRASVSSAVGLLVSSASMGSSASRPRRPHDAALPCRAAAVEDEPADAEQLAVAAERRRRRHQPRRQVLQAVGGPDAGARVEIDQVAADAVARREPHVLDDPLVAVHRQRLAVPRDARRGRTTRLCTSAISVAASSTRVWVSATRSSIVPCVGAQPQVPPLVARVRASRRRRAPRRRTRPARASSRTRAARRRAASSGSASARTVARPESSPP